MMLSNTDWSRFHDSTLLSVELEWATGETRVRARLGAEPETNAEIVVTGTRLLRCPREQPWGPSVSINEVREMPAKAGRKSIEIEIQSGDVIGLEGDDVHLTVRDGAPASP